VENKEQRQIYVVNKVQEDSQENMDLKDLNEDVVGKTNLYGAVVNILMTFWGVVSEEVSKKDEDV